MFLFEEAAFGYLTYIFLPSCAITSTYAVTLKQIKFVIII